MNASSRQADTIAVIALALPEQPTQSDILRALLKAYEAGGKAALAQSAHDLGKALAHVNRRQAE